MQTICWWRKIRHGDTYFRVFTPVMFTRSTREKPAMTAASKVNSSSGQLNGRSCGPCRSGSLYRKREIRGGNRGATAAAVASRAIKSRLVQEAATAEKVIPRCPVVTSPMTTSKEEKNGDSKPEDLCGVPTTVSRQRSR